MGLQIIALLVVIFLTYKAVQKKWNQVVVSILLTALIGLLGLKQQAMEAINGAAAKANADELYGITGTGLGLALLTALIAWFVRAKSRALFILMLVATLVLLNLDASLVNAIRGPISTKMADAWNWFIPWISEQIESI